MTSDQQNTSKGRWMFVPDGWQVVPKKTTYEMRWAYEQCFPVTERWAAMLAASPSPPEVREVTEAMIARILCCPLGCNATGKEGDRCIALDIHHGSRAAIFRLIAPSDQDVTEERK